LWLVVGLVLCGCVAADTCDALDPAINTVGVCFNDTKGLSLGPSGVASFSLYSYDGHNYLVNAQKFSDEIWNVDDPFNPVLEKTIIGLDQCRGPVYANPDKVGDYLVHFGSSAPSCNCVEGQGCIPYVKASMSGQVTQMKLCDNTVYPVNTKDVSAPAKLANPLLACSKLTTSLTGNVAVIQRGLCSFQDKLDNAIAAGAIAVVIVNSNETTDCISPGLSTATVPIVMVTNNDGLPIITALYKGTAVTISLGPTYYFAYSSSQPKAPFGGVWGSSQYVTIAPLSLTSKKDFTRFSDTSLQSFYNPASVVGLNKRPDAETTNYFIVADQTRAAVASIEDGKFSLVTKAFSLPADNLEDIGVSVFFVKDGQYWLATPGFETDKLNLYSLTNVVEGKTPVITKYSSVTQVANQVALPVPPLNNYIYANTGVGFYDCPISNRRYDIYDFTTMSSPQYVGGFQTTMKAGGGTDQANDGDFLLANDGTIVGAVCATSEGVMFYNANDPTNPVVIGSWDSSYHEGSFTNGASGCSAGTDGATWWFNQIDDNAICAVQVQYGPGGVSGASSSLGVSAFIGVIGAFLALRLY